MNHLLDHIEVHHYQHPMGHSYKVHNQRIDQTQMNMVRICHTFHQLHVVGKYKHQCLFHTMISMDNRMVYNLGNRRNLKEKPTQILIHPFINQF